MIFLSESSNHSRERVESTSTNYIRINQPTSLLFWEKQLKREKNLPNKARKLRDHHEEKADEVRFLSLRLHDTGRIFDMLKKFSGFVPHIINRGEWLWNPANFKGPAFCFVCEVEWHHHVTLTVHKPGVYSSFNYAHMEPTNWLNFNCW